VMMPDKLALQLNQLHMLTIEFANYPRIPIIPYRLELLSDSYLLYDSVSWHDISTHVIFESTEIYCLCLTPSVDEGQRVALGQSELTHCRIEVINIVKV